MHDSQTVVARFQPVTPPTSASAAIITNAGEESVGVAPKIQANAGQTFQLSIISNATNGQARVSNGLLYYKPDAGFVGSDAFTFQVTNQYNQSLTKPVKVQVTVLAVNQAPLSSELNITTEQDTRSQAVLPSVTDTTINEQFSYRILLAAQNGVVSLQADGFVYTPVANYSGEDSFQYQVTDSAGNKISAIAQVTVTKKVDNNTGGSTGSGGGGGAIDIELLLMFLLMAGLRFYGIGIDYRVRLKQ